MILEVVQATGPGEFPVILKSVDRTISQLQNVFCKDLLIKVSLKYSEYQHWKDLLILSSPVKVFLKRRIDLTH